MANPYSDDDLPQPPSPKESRRRMAAANGIPDAHVCANCGAELMPHDWFDFMCNACQGLSSPEPMPLEEVLALLDRPFLFWKCDRHPRGLVEWRDRQPHCLDCEAGQ